MGVVTISSSAARTPLGLNTKFSSHRPAVKRSLIVAFKGDKPDETALVSTQHKIPMHVETVKTKKRVGKANKSTKRVRAVLREEAPPSSSDVDYNEAAAILENIYKLSPASDTTNEEYIDSKIRRVSRRGKKIGDEDKQEEIDKKRVVRSQNKKAKRLSLDKRIAMKKNRKGEEVIPNRRRRNVKNKIEKIEELVREYSASTDLVSLDWKKMRIPPVLPSSEHSWLFKLMQPMKVNS